MAKRKAGTPAKTAVKPSKTSTPIERAEVFTDAPVNAILDADGRVVKVMIFDDPIERALTETLQEVISHPQGNVDDEAYWPAWIEAIVDRLSRKLGLRAFAVRASFHRDDRLGMAFEDGNMIRVRVKCSDEVRHTILVDPTPED
ncbi:MAG: hypothetical protein ACSHXY_09860 [Alphaproteobacteria bacterium]